MGISVRILGPVTSDTVVLPVVAITVPLRRHIRVGVGIPSALHVKLILFPISTGTLNDALIPFSITGATSIINNSIIITTSNNK